MFFIAAGRCRAPKQEADDMLTFFKLKVGERFKFANEARYTSLACGPWIKVSPRRYKHVDGGPIHTVGSQIVEVVKEGSDAAHV